MSELKCNLVEDLMPLYIDDLVSDDTKQDIEEHLSECEACRSMCEELKRDINSDIRENINLNEEESEKLKTDTLNSISKYLNKIKYIFIIFSISVAVGISLLGGGFLSTIPWIIIIPFVLGLLYDEKIFILATVIAANILFTIVMKNGFLGVWTGVYFLICSFASLFLASAIKQLKNN